MSDLGMGASANGGIFQFVGPVSDEKTGSVSFELKDLNQKARADDGSLVDQYRLGKAYFKAGNVQRAEYYFAILANQQFAKAEYQLGLLYEEVYKNSEAALCCFQRAAAKGNAEAQFKLGLLLKELFPTQAFVYFKSAAEQDHALAQFYTALCFQYGRGVYPDQEQAEFFFKKVACEGFKEKNAFEKFCDVLVKSNAHLSRITEGETILWHSE